jgi:four helix bundle protein
MAAKIKSYHDLRIWKMGIQLVKSTYNITGQFPQNEVFGLSGQMQRAAVSIPSNIAEGHIRGSDKEFK